MQHVNLMKDEFSGLSSASPLGLDGSSCHRPGRNVYGIAAPHPSIPSGMTLVQSKRKLGRCSESGKFSSRHVVPASHEFKCELGAPS